MDLESPVNTDNSLTEQKSRHNTFNDLFESSIQRKTQDVVVIDYTLPYPKEDFLKYLVVEKNILLHGSSNGDIETLEPRQANDGAKLSGNKKAVYAVTDPILPIFYAIQDRSKLHGIIRSGVSKDVDSGKVEYSFSIPKGQLEAKPWGRGVIYIFDKSQFHPEVNDAGKPSGEWTAETPVKPIAKLEVGPEDFPFMDSVVESS